MATRTATTEDQDRVQALIEQLYAEKSRMDEVEVLREVHLEYASRGLRPLPAAFVGLDANLPWICYWNLHSIDLLSDGIPADAVQRALGALRACQHPDGGFGGGLGQDAHLACTFAAVSALATIGTPEAFDLIDVDGLRRFLGAMRQPNGSFSMQRGGEADCRGSYCALAAASLCGLLQDIAGEQSAAYLAACQTHEGGLGGVPWAEAHAGYTYCGFAALTILAQARLVDLDGLAAFARRSQCTQSGGFRGRTNKLVDGCYSFWAGALFPLIRRALPSLPPFDTAGLQAYLLVCCQDSQGGLRDKPGRSVDYYHTCYCLSGLSIAQHEPSAAVLGLSRHNCLPEIDPAYNLRIEKAARIKEHFAKSRP